MSKNFKRRDLNNKEYIPQSHIEEKEPLTFIFKPLTNIEIARFEDMYNKYDINSNEMVSAINEVDYKIAITQLVGWRNLVIEDELTSFDINLVENIDIVQELVELGKYIYIISKSPELELKLEKRELE